MDDLQLWARLKQGDHAALRQIYDNHILQLSNYAVKFTQDTGLIEDTIHDLFIYIWERRESLSNTDSIIKYLCVSLRRDLIRKINQSVRDITFEKVENIDTEFSLSVEDMIIKEELDTDLKGKLQEAYNQLSARQKEAIFLKYYQEMEYEQICEIMDINYQSVRNLISKGIIELRKFIGIILLTLSFLFFPL